VSARDDASMTHDPILDQYSDDMGDLVYARPLPISSTSQPA
jgi:hypothetical protein